MRTKDTATQPERVLAVEDDALVLMMAVEMLADLGYKAHEASSADEALESMSQEPVDILLTDVGLVGTSGVQLAIEAKRRYPDLKLIFATGHSVVDEMDASPELRHAVLLMKPFDESELAQALNAVKLRPGQQKVEQGVKT